MDILISTITVKRYYDKHKESRSASHGFVNSMRDLFLVVTYLLNHEHNSNLWQTVQNNAQPQIENPEQTSQSNTQEQSGTHEQTVPNNTQEQSGTLEPTFRDNMASYFCPKEVQEDDQLLREENTCENTWVNYAKSYVCNKEVQENDQPLPTQDNPLFHEQSKIFSTLVQYMDFENITINQTKSMFKMFHEQEINNVISKIMSLERLLEIEYVVFFRLYVHFLSLTYDDKNVTQAEDKLRAWVPDPKTKEKAKTLLLQLKPQRFEYQLLSLFLDAADSSEKTDRMIENRIPLFCDIYYFLFCALPYLIPMFVRKKKELCFRTSKNRYMTLNVAEGDYVQNDQMHPEKMLELLNKNRFLTHKLKIVNAKGTQSKANTATNKNIRLTIDNEHDFAKDDPKHFFSMVFVQDLVVPYIRVHLVGDLLINIIKMR